MEYPLDQSRSPVLAMPLPAPHAPPHWQSMGRWKVLDSGKNYSATARMLLCLQRCSHTKSKMQHYTSYLEERELCPSQNKDNKLHESLNTKVRKKLTGYMEGYCKICFPFFPFIEDENICNIIVLFYFLHQFPFPHVFGEKKQSRTSIYVPHILVCWWYLEANVWHICNVCVDNHKDEGKTAVRIKILQCNYTVMWIKLVIIRISFQEHTESASAGVFLQEKWAKVWWSWSMRRVWNAAMPTLILPVCILGMRGIRPWIPCWLMDLV